MLQAFDATPELSPAGGRGPNPLKLSIPRGVSFAMTRKMLVSACAAGACSLAAMAAIAVSAPTPPDADSSEVASAATDESKQLRVNGVLLPGWKDGPPVLVDARSRAYQLEGAGAAELAGAGRRRVEAAGVLVAPDSDLPGIRRLRLSGYYEGKRAKKPKTVRIRGLRTGARLRGRTPIRARARTRGRLELRVDGRPKSIRTLGRASWARMSWNASRLRPGGHLVEVSLWRGSRRIGVDRRWVEVTRGVGKGPGGAPGAPTPGGSKPGTPPAVAPPPGPNEPLPGTRVFSASYENGSTSPWRVRETVSPERIKVVSSPKAAEGTRSARFEVRPGEDPLGNFGDRAELAFAGPSIEEGQEYWYEWFTLFPQGFPTESGRVWQVFSQWHSRGNGPPPLGWYVEGNQMVLVANRHAAERQRLEARTLWKGAIKPGQWRRIRMNVKFSGSDSVGFVRLWIDGKQVISKANVRTTYPGLGNYFKQGYYRCACSSSTAVVHHDGLIITQVR